MKQTIFQVDSFTKKAFHGNPAGVMILKEDLEDALMQNIAMEMNLSETAFLHLHPKLSCVDMQPLPLPTFCMKTKRSQKMNVLNLNPKAAF